jgi:DNA ligase (NAD+)
MNLQDLKKRIEDANKAYRLGNSLISDSEYDALIDQLSILSPDDELLSNVGVKIDDERKTKLPIIMASMNKLKTIVDILSWVRNKGISDNAEVIITPKFDGLSLCVDIFNNDAFTRGDGEYGQKSNEHYKYIQNHAEMRGYFSYIVGEVIMPKKVFVEKYSDAYANPRNLVAGLMNKKEPTEPLRDCVFMKYGAIQSSDEVLSTKKEIIDVLNYNQLYKVNYHICKISDLSEKLLIDLFHQFSTDFEIDGVIIEINDLAMQERLGRETSTLNPVFARAFKHASFEQSKQTTVIGISWNISKQGLLKPILHVNPIQLDGVIVSNVTGNNARFVKDMGLGVGAEVIIKRSGMVIPLIIDVVKSVKFEMPTIEGADIVWNENGIELITTTETDEQKLKKIIAFFQILEADNVSEGVITQLWDAGYKTIKDILALKENDLLYLDGFAERKAEIVYNSIHKAVTDVELSKLQHATGIFKGLGSKKLVLLEDFTTKPILSDVMNIEGFAEISAQAYIDGYDEFFEFIKNIPEISIKQKKEIVMENNDLEGLSFCFTGIRRKDLELIMEARGAKILSGVSKNLTHLVMKAKGSGSSKEQKAIELGVKIITVEELEEMLVLK